MQSVISLILVISLLSLSACTSMRRLVALVKADTSQALLLLPPELSGHSGVAKQKITMNVGDKQQTFIALTQYAVDRYQVLVMLPTGQTVLSMRYDGEVLTEFASWPEAVIKKSYTQVSGREVLTQANMRQLLVDRKPLLTVTYSQNNVVHISHYIQKYQVTVEPLEGQQ